MVTSIAHADAIFETPNQGGGKIVLTDELCRDNSHKLAYSMIAGADTILGCWAADSQYVHIGWYDGSLRSYPVDGWVYLKSNKSNL
jgi:hypothetical protein